MLTGWTRRPSDVTVVLLLSGCGINNTPTCDEAVNAACGQLLAAHFPAADKTANTLPDRLVEL